MPSPRDIPALPVCTIRVHRHPAWTAVMLRGELDLQGEKELRRSVSAAVEHGKPILVELTGLDFIDLRGIRVLVAMVHRGRSRKPPIEVELHGARGQVAQMLSRLGPDHQ